MAITPNLGVTLLDPGQAQPHLPHNDALMNIDKAIAGRFTKDMTGATTYTLTSADSTNQMLYAFGAPGAAVTWTVQSTTKLWTVINGMAFDLTVKTAAGTGVLVPAGFTALLYCDGTNIHGQLAAIIENCAVVDGKNIQLGSTNGTQIGTVATQKLGLWGAVPVVRPVGANQAAIVGTAGATYTATEQGLINALVTLVNQLRADLVTIGAIKGSA